VFSSGDSRVSAGLLGKLCVVKQGWLIVVAVCLAGYGVLAWVSMGRMSLTFDESLHIAGAYAIEVKEDFRINPEDPPGFQRVLGLTMREGDWPGVFSGEQWDKAVSDSTARWNWSNRTVCGGETFNRELEASTVRVRTPMLGIAIVLGAVTVGFAWLVGGRVAAMLVAVVFALDPTMLGHGGLVKNDVPLAVGYTVVAIALVLLWRKLTWWGVLLLAGAAAWSVCTKFSGLLLGPGVVLALGLRAMWPGVWEADLGLWRGELRIRLARVLAVAGVAGVCTAAVWLGVWGVYGFRYSITPDAGVRADLEVDKRVARTYVLWKSKGTLALNPAAIAEQPVPMPIRVMERASEMRLVPEAFAKGFVFTYATTMLRWSFLLDEICIEGRWQYFPVVVLTKLPLGLLGFLGLGLTLAWWFGRREMLGVAVLAGFYLAVAVGGDMNLGVRHLIPVLPMVYVMSAVVLARAWEAREVGGRKRMAWGLAGLGVLLLGEVGSAGARFFSFFNVPARWYGPERILGDSNLDWGQDLYLLREWQARNPGVSLSLSYFGTLSPEALGIVYVPLEGTLQARSPLSPVTPPGVIVVSVTNLQETMLSSDRIGLYYNLRLLRPMEVIGETMHVYHWPPRPQDIRGEPWRIRILERGERFDIRPLK
jgi:hypothetical protein